MKYKIVLVTGQLRQVLAEVVSDGWAKSFAEDVESWIKENDGESITKVVIEEKRG